jgi:hypothetical protein
MTSRRLKKLRELLAEIKALNEFMIYKYGVVADITLGVRVNSDVMCQIDECMIIVEKSKERWIYLIVNDYTIEKVVMTPRKVEKSKLKNRELESILERHRSDIDKALKRLRSIMKLLDNTIKKIERQERKRLIQNIERISDGVRQQLQH